MEPGAACIMPGGLASDRATAPGQMGERNEQITDNRVIREKKGIIILLQVLKTLSLLNK